jgi:hypothetical protein
VTPAIPALPNSQNDKLNGQKLVRKNDRGPKGTHHGAIIANGCLYCPQTPPALLQLGPLPPGATPDATAAHDQQAAELARHKLGRRTADDAGGYHRVMCPAAMGKIRCPLRPASMLLTRDRPEILTPPGHPPACCTQQTITVPPDVAAKTRQKHDYPSPQWRRSYQRRTAAERVNATIKDTATTSIARGWCRLTGLAPLTPCGPPACSRSATSASSPPGTPGRTTTPAAPPPTCRPAPANDAVPPSPSCQPNHIHPAPQQHRRTHQPQRTARQQHPRPLLPANPPATPASRPGQPRQTARRDHRASRAECQTQM